MYTEYAFDHSDEFTSHFKDLINADAELYTIYMGSVRTKVTMVDDEQISSSSISTVEFMDWVEERKEL